MCKDDINQTRYTLLGRALELSDEEAWRELSSNYQSYIFHLLHRLDVNPSDIDDLAQQVMLGLTTKLRLYDRSKGKFRSWLSVVVKNEVMQAYRKQKSRSRTLERFTSEVEVNQESESSPFDDLIISEWERFIYNKAMVRAKENASEAAIKTMELTLEGKSAEEISSTLGIAVTTVYNLRLIVKQQLTRQIQMIRNELEE